MQTDPWPEHYGDVYEALGRHSHFYLRGNLPALWRLDSETDPDGLMSL